MVVPNNVQRDFIKNIKKKYKNIKFTYLFSPPFRKLSIKEIKNIHKEINKSKFRYFVRSSWCSQARNLDV